jgi:hypothetical protein
VVVRASVADLAFRDRAPRKDGAAAETQWVTVTLKVRSALKGEAPATVAFVVEQHREHGALAAWKESGQSMLWFLVDVGDKKEALAPDAPPPPPGRLRLRGNDIRFPGTAAVQPAAGPVWSMALRRLEGETAVLAAVKEGVALRDVRPLELLLPLAVARVGNYRDTHVLVVPVCPRLERVAHGWARAREQWIRASALRALTLFRSEANTAVVKGLLGDESLAIREAAYLLLQEWKVAVPRPLPAGQ